MKLALVLSLFAATPAFATDLTLPPTPDALSLQAVVFGLLQDMHNQTPANVAISQDGRSTILTLGGADASLACQSDGQFSCTVKNEEGIVTKSADTSSVQALLYQGLDTRQQAQQQKRDRKQPLGPTLPVDRFESFTENGLYLVDGKFSLACYKVASPVSYYCETRQVPPQQQPSDPFVPKLPGRDASH